MTKEQLQKAEEIGSDIERMENLIKKYDGEMEVAE